MKSGIINTLIVTFCFVSFKQDNTNVNPEIIDDYSSITNITDYKKWGVYNVHDPSCIKAGEYFYLYSTDAIYWPHRAVSKSDTIHIGNIQVRRSTDLVHWEFLGWAFDSIPHDAVESVKKSSDGKLPNGIWAPYITQYNNEYRLYYAVSVFGANTSYIGLAKSKSPGGPWQQIGCVVQTSKTDSMNAIDPTVVFDARNGRNWMIYGSFFGGIFCVELNPTTGLTKITDDKGFCIARRANGTERVIESPEVIYNSALKKYFLFVSYDALFTHYNVRVGRADKPEGPYYDFFGKNLNLPINHYPVLTYAYRFNHHNGWAGVGHCGVINDNNNFFMLHQGRLAPDNQMMVLHVRKIEWTNDGWPTVSPERYVNITQHEISKDSILGNWEVIELNEIADSVKLWQGQIPWGGWHYSTKMFNNSVTAKLLKNGTTEGFNTYSWKLSKNSVSFFNLMDTFKCNVIIGWDWENSRKSYLFTGLNKSGRSIWGKKVN